ncbi:hypothetical protein [Peptoniphilus grossensis]|uniref:hypothetical protein n=1 Tax=Peptoniphilus grossensis TaxID=1465756 RepID=UPI004068229D
MDNKKKIKAKANANRVAAYALSGVMLASMIPYNVFASPAGLNNAIEIEGEKTPAAQKAPLRESTPDALSSATYYKKANWENKIKDKSRWPVGDNQRLVRVTTSDPVEMTDIDYDGLSMPMAELYLDLFTRKRVQQQLLFGIGLALISANSTNTSTMTNPTWLV